MLDLKIAKYDNLLMKIINNLDPSWGSLRLTKIWYKCFGSYQDFSSYDPGDNPDDDYSLYVEMFLDVVHHVHHNLFPISDEHMNMYWQAGELERVLFDNIQYDAYGLCREFFEFNYISNYEKPVIYLYPELLKKYDLIDERGVVKIHEWWQSRGRNLNDLNWRYQKGVDDALLRLPEPLNGLWLINAAIHKKTGNYFIDTGGCWDIDIVNPLYWTAENIELLTAQYNEVEGNITSFEFYREWYTQSDESKIIEALFNLEVS